VICPNSPDPYSTVCEVGANNPGTGPSSGTGQGGGQGGTPKCSWLGTTVPCWLNGRGWFDNSKGCYYLLLDPQPAQTDPVWQGRPAGGAAYKESCFTTVQPGLVNMPWLDRTVWLPVGVPAAPLTPGAVAQIAISEITMNGPSNGVAPPVGSYVLVGMPMWLWTAQGATTWGPQTVVVTAGGITVTATATATSVTWYPGDGNSVTCAGPGTPYDPATASRTVSPTCSYTYSRTSGDQPDQLFRLHGVTTWVITWAGGGQTGTVTRQVPSTPVPVRVESAQALLTSE
jgi:hypothetical protein